MYAGRAPKRGSAEKVFTEASRPIPYNLGCSLAMPLRDGPGTG